MNPDKHCSEIESHEDAHGGCIVLSLVRYLRPQTSLTVSMAAQKLQFRHTISARPFWHRWSMVPRPRFFRQPHGRAHAGVPGVMPLQPWYRANAKERRPSQGLDEAAQAGAAPVIRFGSASAVHLCVLISLAHSASRSSRVMRCFSNASLLSIVTILP